ncbi:MAG: hypothetical protein ACHQ7M_02905 [Chloroflexota bacterium]
MAAPEATAGLEAAVPAPPALAPAAVLGAPVAGLAEAAVLTAMEAVAPPELEVVVTVPPQAANAANEPAATSAMPNRRNACM